MFDAPDVWSNPYDSNAYGRVIMVSTWYQLVFTEEKLIVPLFLPFLSSSCLLVSDDFQAPSPWLLISSDCDNAIDTGGFINTGSWWSGVRTGWTSIYYYIVISYTNIIYVALSMHL
jgi:hypothetical protein